MSEALNVIALISGGKDSIFSIIHCLQNGHRIVALANLHPLSNPTLNSREGLENDLNSHMYQSVGYNIIPLYESAFRIPLYRQPIFGTAVQTDLTYQPPSEGIDETESLVPLLQTIRSAHPEANAVSSGAILSTYQRTRVESVALRLGLTPLSFLWRYPTLPPGTPTSLLGDMANAGLDARLIKVASGGLDESFLWENVASDRGMRRVDRAVSRFGINGDGAVLGEGGEFETLAIDGPMQLFKGKIVVDEHDREIIRESGGTARMNIKNARVELKKSAASQAVMKVRTPDLLDDVFSKTLDMLLDQYYDGHQVHSRDDLSHGDKVDGRHPISMGINLPTTAGRDLSHPWTLSSQGQGIHGSIEDEIECIITQLRTLLREHGLQIVDVVSTVILLRSMKDFAKINKRYGAFFNGVNPPARVTIACGSMMPLYCNVIIHARLYHGQTERHSRKSLHVQSRSYWAPANIGPYSQAQALPLNDNGSLREQISKVYIAGQIPLVPATMSLPLNSMNVDSRENTSATMENDMAYFNKQAVLSLQHLWRIGSAMNVCWWTAATAYLSRDKIERIQVKARAAGAAWENLHNRDKSLEQRDGEDEIDLWEERYHRGVEKRGGPTSASCLPDWSQVDCSHVANDYTPPVFAVEIEELPRDSFIEWHAHLGITAGPIEVFSHVDIGIGTVEISIVGRREAFLTVMIPYKGEIELRDLEITLDNLARILEAQGIRKISRTTGYYGSYASYVDALIPSLWSGSGYGGTVPCRSLWDQEGTRLAAVLLFSSVMKD